MLLFTSAYDIPKRRNTLYEPCLWCHVRPKKDYLGFRWFPCITCTTAHHGKTILRNDLSLSRFPYRICHFLYVLQLYLRSNNFKGKYSIAWHICVNAEWFKIGGQSNGARRVAIRHFRFSKRGPLIFSARLSCNFEVRCIIGPNRSVTLGEENFFTVLQPRSNRSPGFLRDE